MSCQSTAQWESTIPNGIKLSCYSSDREAEYEDGVWYEEEEAGKGEEGEEEDEEGREGDDYDPELETLDEDDDRGEVEDDDEHGTDYSRDELEGEEEEERIVASAETEAAKTGSDKVGGKEEHLAG